MAETTVYDFLELRSAIQVGTDLIYLGADITVNVTGGAIIPRDMGAITIDGQGIYSITDRDSAASSSTIRIATSSGNPLTITIQNLTWYGMNIYGVVYIPDSTGTSNITLVFNNVDYTGPQAVFNRYGTTKFIDSTFLIKRSGTASAVQELGEVNTVSIAGNVSVTSEVPSSIYSIFWFPHSGSSFTVEDNATFTVESVYNYMFYSDVEVPMVFGENSKSEFNLARGFFYYDGSTLHMASSFLLKKGASFIANTGRTAGSYSIFRCRDSFILEEDSYFYLATTAAGTGASLYFPTASTVEFRNPKSVVIYNNGGNAISFGAGTAANPNTIIIDAELLNYWAAATPFPTAGTFDDPPTRAFSKADGSNINTTLKTTSSVVSSVITNIEDGDKGYPMTAGTFPVLSAKVISMGNLKMSVDDISDIDTEITGTTESNANLRAIYNATTINGMASVSGEIALPIPRIPVDTVVDFGANWRFLTKYVQKVVEGSVTITYLPDLVFKTFMAPCRRNTVNRKNADWYLEVTDTRTRGDLSDWLLYAALPAPMSSGSDTLDNTLVLRGDTDTVMTPTFVLIRQQAWTSPPPVVTHITWPEVDGFLLKVDPDYRYNSGIYSSKLDWYVVTESEKPLGLEN